MFIFNQTNLNLKNNLDSVQNKPNFKGIKPSLMTKPLSPKVLKMLSAGAVVSWGTAFILDKKQNNGNKSSVPENIRIQREQIEQDLIAAGLQKEDLIDLDEQGLKAPLLIMLNFIKKFSPEEYKETLPYFKNFGIDRELVESLKSINNSEYFINNAENILVETMEIYPKSKEDKNFWDTFITVYSNQDKEGIEKLQKLISSNKDKLGASMTPKNFLTTIKNFYDNGVTEATPQQIEMYHKVSQKINYTLTSDVISNIFSSSPEDLDAKDKYLNIIEKERKGIYLDCFNAINDANIEFFDSFFEQYDYMYTIAQKLKPIKAYNKNFAKELYGKNIPEAQGIMERTNKDNIRLIEKFYKHPDVTADMLISILDVTLLYKNIDALNIREIFTLNNAVQNLSDSVKDLLKKENINTDVIKHKISNMIKKKDSYIETNKDNQIKFFANFVSNNNHKAEKILKNFKFKDYAKTGLPLKYTREGFNSKIEEILSTLSSKEQKILMEHFGLKMGVDGFDGRLNNKKFSSTLHRKEVEEAAKKIQAEIKSFTLDNEFLIEDKEAKEIFDSLIRGIPEFTFYVGKKQHGEHKYTTDIHSFKVLQDSMNHPDYENLDDSSKTVLKIATLLHDIGKNGGVTDPGHAEKSSVDVQVLLKKFPFKRKIVDRIIQVVHNHHWFESYCDSKNPNKEVGKIAALCSYPNDLVIYKIFAKSDFQNVNEEFHFKRSKTRTSEEYNNYIEEKVEPIKKCLEEVYTNTNLIFDTKFIDNGERFPREKAIVKGKETMLKVLNLNEIKDDEDLEKYGFPKGTTKNELRLFVHMLSKFGIDGNITKFLTEHPMFNTCWSTSLISLLHKDTYADFGFVLDVEHRNIAEAFSKNLGSGKEKNLDLFVNILFRFQNEARNFIKNAFLEELSNKGVNLSNKEYARLVKQLIKKDSLNQVNTDFKVNGKIIDKDTLIECLEKSRDKLFVQNRQNEVVVLNPRIKGMLGKASKLEDCPQDFLEFAYENDLPIILIK